MGHQIRHKWNPMKPFIPDVMSAVREALLGRRVLVWLFLVVYSGLLKHEYNSGESGVEKHLLTLLKIHQKCSKPVVMNHSIVFKLYQIWTAITHVYEEQSYQICMYMANYKYVYFKGGKSESFFFIFFPSRIPTNSILCWCIEYRNRHDEYLVYIFECLLICTSTHNFKMQNEGVENEELRGLGELKNFIRNYPQFKKSLKCQ